MPLDLTTVTPLFPLFFSLIGLTFTVMIDPYISRRNRIIMLVILALSVTLIAQNLLEDWLATGPPQWFWRTTVSIYGYIVRPVFLILFLYIIHPEKKHLPAWGLAYRSPGIPDPVSLYHPSGKETSARLGVGGYQLRRLSDSLLFPPVFLDQLRQRVLQRPVGLHLSLCQRYSARGFAGPIHP